MGNTPINNIDDGGCLSVPDVFYPGQWNIYDNKPYYSVVDTTAVTAEIRYVVNMWNTASALVLGNDSMVYGFIASNLRPGGDLDYGMTDKTYGETGRYEFDGETMTGHGFANNLFGYANGYAMFTCSDGGFGDVACGATLADGVRDTLHGGGFAGLADVYNGFILGTIDALFGSDDD